MSRDLKLIKFFSNALFCVVAFATFSAIMILPFIICSDNTPATLEDEIVFLKTIIVFMATIIVGVPASLFLSNVALKKVPSLEREEFLQRRAVIVDRANDEYSWHSTLVANGQEDAQVLFEIKSRTNKEIHALLNQYSFHKANKENT